MQVRGSLDVTFDNITYRLYSPDTTRGLYRGVRVTGEPYRPSNRVYNGVLGHSRSSESWPVVVKLAFNAQQLEVLRREAGFYTKELVPLQGSIVPTFFGFYERDSLDQPPILGCLILEKYNAVPKSMSDIIEYSRQAMLGICKLHQAGVYHGGLNGTRDVISTLNGPRILDFSKAFRHECLGCTPLLVTRNGVSGDSSGCSELAEAEKIYGSLETMEGIEHRRREQAKAVRAQMQLVAQYDQSKSQALACCII